jgi:hypothetical protein
MLHVVLAYAAAAYLASLCPLPLPSLAYFSSIQRYSTYALAVRDNKYIIIFCLVSPIVSFIYMFLLIARNAINIISWYLLAIYIIIYRPFVIVALIIIYL